MMLRKVKLTESSWRGAPGVAGLFLVLVLAAGCGTSRKAAKETPAVRLERQQYIEKYAPLAQEEMKRTGIPASITMAQALLESNDGNSYLAVYGKNHFGIKCHRDWRGKKIYYDDDAKHECFRKYNNVEESYRDHSDFLMNKDRYAFLFRLDPTDYKGWAKGLKKAGYATNPHYAQMLIKIIEDYHLYDLDTKKYRPSKSVAASREALDALSHDELVELALARDTVAAPEMSDEFVVSTGGRRQVLTKYNELDKHATLKEGQILYLQPKRRQAELGKKEHLVQEGETMYLISQKYAIRLKYLYEMNDMKPGEEPQPGETIRLRK